MPSGRAGAQPDVLVTELDAKDVAAPPGAEYLPVSGAVAQEAYLGEHDRKDAATASCHHESRHDEGSPSGGAPGSGGCCHALMCAAA